MKYRNFKTKSFITQTKAIISAVNSIAGKDVCFLDNTGSYTFIEFTDKSKICAVNTKNGWGYTQKYMKKMALAHKPFVDYALENLFIVRDGEKIINPHMATLTWPSNYDVTAEATRLKSLIKTIKPLHTSFLQQGGDGCWHLNGLIQHTAKRVKDIEESGTTLKQLNDLLLDGLTGKTEIIYPKKVKNILNDILTIVQYNTKKEISNGNISTSM